LLAADTMIGVRDLQAMARVPVDVANGRYLKPFLRDIKLLDASLGSSGRAVLLGSVATRKYVDPLLGILGERLLFPTTFVGRGDMSRGGLLLRCVRAGMALECAPVLGATRTGPRPPRLDRPRRPRSHAEPATS